MATVLSSLINEAVVSGSYPNVYKGPRVTLIHKSGSTLDFKNYRLISVLPFPNKVFERALHSRILQFYHIYNAIYEDQYSFLKNKSTTDAVLKFTRSVTRHSIAKDTLFQTFSTLVRRLMLFVLIL